jgi:pyruvate dehydrogenase E2 component (dihydrolipoyllysine-residue acetyltransferase)
MAIPITIPRLGWNMEEGVFGGWLKADGDTVRPGDLLFCLESDKATEEIESLDAGTLRIPPDGPKEGDKLPVGAVIGYLVAAGEEPVPARPATSATAPSPAAAAAASRERERSVQRPAISPRARRAAAELGIEWTTLNGSGRTGRIRERDVRAAAALSPFPPALRGRGEIDSSSLPHIRRTIAARVVGSLRTTAPVTLTTTADATNLVNLRAQYKSATDGGPAPSYTDLLVKLATTAIQKHPALTGQWTDDGIRLPDGIHIGIAVDTDAGLLVPVVRDVLALGLRQLAAKTHDLIERARSGRLSASDMQGGCFTVTNLGAFGIDAFTPIINHPECAILGVGRIARRPAVVGDAIVARDQVTLSLTFDHRIVDGAPAARFLQTLVQMIESPAPWLAT